MTKTKFALVAFSTSSLLALSAPAFAQSTGTSSPTQGPAQNAAATEPATLGEVVVTAQKRVQNVQDVPLAVTVVGADQLARQNIQQISSLPNAVPALEVQNIPGQGGGPSIRGIGTSAVSLTSENAVALVLDGVVLGRAPLNSLFDIGRVEVLRGPQGMLFGKNASAGVLNITTNAPDPSRFSVIGHADIGTKYNYGVYQLTVNAPISDTAALRVSGHINNTGGLIHNVTNGSDSLDYDSGVRARLLWEPTDKLTINLIADYDRQKQNNLFLQWDYVGPTATGLQGILAGCGVSAGRGNRDTCIDQPTYNDNETYGFSGQIDYKLGDFTLTSITADRALRSVGNSDIDITPRNLLGSNTKAGNDTFSQEVRLTSPAHGRFEYVAGVYFSDVHVRQDTHGYATVPLISFDTPFGPLVIVPPINASDYGTAQLKSTAIFGQGTVHVTDALRLILGARQTWDDISTSDHDRVAQTFTSDSASKGNFSYKVGAQYDISHDVMAYATFTRGYKGPQVNLPTNAAPGGIVRPEVPIAYEIGVKGSLFDNRLAVDLNAFYTTVHNFQTQVLTNTAAGPQFIIGNVPEVKTKGIELDVFGRPLPGLSINGGAIFNPAKYGNFVAQDIRGDNVDVTGNQLAFTPKWKFNLSAEYVHAVTDTLDAVMQSDIVYKSKVDFLAPVDPLTTLDHQVLLGARLGVRSHDGRYGISVWGRNLLDKRYPANLQVGPLANFQGGLGGGIPSVAHVLTTDSFRTFGVSLDGKF